ncbi:MAG: hypothetical protein V3U75_07845 [Methylococcaceae bacterium]
MDTITNNSDITSIFHYQIPWRTNSVNPDYHRSTWSGGDYELQGHTPLISHSDPRKLDIHASFRDPLGQFIARTFRQQATIQVYVIADLSASMGIQGLVKKLELLASFTTTTVYSTYRTGDPFGFFACGTQILWNLCLPLGQHQGMVEEVYQELSRHRPSDNSFIALQSASEHLSKKRALVFLVSDFHFPLNEISQIFESLSFHDVVPVVLWDKMEYLKLPRWGLTRMSDPETGQERSLFMQPSLHDRFATVFDERRSDLIKLCLQYGREPFFLGDKFDPDDLTWYFFC